MGMGLGLRKTRRPRFYSDEKSRSTVDFRSTSQIEAEVRAARLGWAVHFPPGARARVGHFGGLLVGCWASSPSAREIEFFGLVYSLFGPRCR